jgi:hypothetical protein
VRAGLSATNAAMSCRSAMAGVSALLGSLAPVSGLVSCVHSQRKISRRSYVCPSEVATGSSITSWLIGQRYWAGTWNR